ncbi:Mu-like prophage major head subunit gpT family protein [Nevskia ramosa]|uniref:Mu-like prophage major head subunit gpT family protein n=1 Tax=Nevskia ramosa TaxID=64002 RepID=UPI0023564C9F|nr:Mu-like prophage major head subunit gpT family protein [Nevskia ramosa]
MSIVTPQLILNLNAGFSAAFREGFGSVKPQWNSVAMLATSKGSSNTYGWLGKFPGFREWAGDRVVNSMKAHGYSIVNKAFEATMGVGRDEIEDDLTDTYGTLFREAGVTASLFPDKLVFGAVNAAASSLCYDGQFFFDTDHPVYPNVDGTGTAVSVANFVAGSNPTWYLLDLSRSLKPFILQERKKAAFTAMDRPDDESVFVRKEFRYGIDGRWNAGYGLWQLAYASRAALTHASLDAAITAMEGFKADGGEPLGVRPTAILFPSTLRATVENIIDKEKIDGGDSNTHYKRLTKIQSDYLATT